MRLLAAAAAAALVATLAPASALAVDATTKAAIVGSGRYGNAGCGLGSVIFGDQPGAVQVLAATTNGVVSANQTFAQTTGTSNCGPGLIAQGTRAFVEGNRVALAKDAARGEGESIQAVAAINRCEDVPAVAAALQKNYAAIFPSAAASDADVTDALLKTLHSDPALGCKAG